MNEFFPIIIIEVFLIFGSVLLFYWWSMRDIKRWKDKNRKKKKSISDD